MDILLGIDIGTSSTRVIAINSMGQIIAIGQKEYVFDIPSPGWAQQNPEVWWQAVISCIKDIKDKVDLTTHNILAIGLSGQMHGIVPLAEDNTVCYPAILWCDQRSARQVKKIEDIIGRERIGNITHSPIAVGFFLPSLLWIREHEHEIYNRIRTCILPKDYIRYKLTDIIASEITDAAATGAFDAQSQTWSQEILNQLDIPLTLMPQLGKPEAIAGYLTEKAAKELGIKQGIPIAYGGGDQVMQAIGNGINKEGTALVTIGTAGQILMPMEVNKYDQSMRTHGFAFVGGKSYYMGAVLASGLSLRWARNLINPHLSYKEIDEGVRKIPPGAEGLIFLPYLCGERTPHMDPYARGVFLGLTLSHTPMHLFRAVMEGVVFSLKDCLGILVNDLHETVTTLIASGGASQSNVWMQMQADILGKEIITSNMKEQSGVGAAITAGVAVGAYASFDQAFDEIIRWNKTPITPNPKNEIIYSKIYQIYKKAYSANRILMHRLGQATEDCQEE